jgi:internalin A
MDSYSERHHNPASLICFRFTGQSATSFPELKHYKNLVTPTQTELDLSDNCIESEIAELSSLKYLKKLSLSCNHITDLWPLPRTLESLTLSCNHISMLPCFDLPRLQLLDLSCNLISTLAQFVHLAQLKSLFLGYNLIRDLSLLDQMPSLKEIDLEHNLIESLDTMQKLVESSVLVFIIKNNPAAR